MVPLTETLPWPASFPAPRTKWPPLPSNRCTATRSSQLSVATSRMRCATGFQSGLTVASPAKPGMRRPSATMSSSRIIIFVGIQPKYGHSPPTRLLSMPTTFSPLSAREPAISSPPTPMPRTMASTRSATYPAPGCTDPDFHRIGNGLLEAHRLPLGPDPCRFIIVESLPAGAAFLLAAQAPPAGTATDLMGGGRRKQSACAEVIAIVACQDREIVELENHPRNVPGVC